MSWSVVGFPVLVGVPVDPEDTMFWLIGQRYLEKRGRNERLHFLEASLLKEVGWIAGFAVVVGVKAFFGDALLKMSHFSNRDCNSK